MLPRRFNTIGSCLDTEMRIFMALIIARALERPIKSLPPMSDTQLWQSFKVASSKIKPYSNISEAISNPLNPGDIYAIEVGKYLDTPVFPQGENFEEIWENAKVSRSEINFEPEDDFWQILLLSSALFGLRELNHPKAESFYRLIGHEKHVTFHEDDWAV